MYKNNCSQITWLRIFATVGVVLIHTSSALVDNLDKYHFEQCVELFYKSIKNSFFWAVPVFFMITGFLLLSKKDISVFEILNKYIRRVIFALIIFGFPMAMIKSWFSIGVIDFSFIIVDGLKRLITNNGFSHLWYLYTLIGIYFVLPFLKKFTEIANKEEFCFVLIVLFVFLFIIPQVGVFFPQNIAFSIPFSYEIFYVLLGYYIMMFVKPKRKNRFLYDMVIIAGTALIWICHFKFDFLCDLVIGYNRPLIAVLSIFIFLRGLLLNVAVNNSVWKIDRMCFGVYLVHPLPIQLAYNLNITPLNYGNKMVSLVPFWIVFTLSSFIITWLFRKIPFLKNNVL